MESSTSNRKKSSKSSARIRGGTPSRTRDNLSRSSTQNEHAQYRASSSSSSSSAAPADQQQSSAQSSGAVRPQSARTVRTSDAAAIARGASGASTVRCIQLTECHHMYERRIFLCKYRQKHCPFLDEYADCRRRGGLQPIELCISLESREILSHVYGYDETLGPSHPLGNLVWCLHRVGAPVSLEEATRIIFEFKMSDPSNQMLDPALFVRLCIKMAAQFRRFEVINASATSSESNHSKQASNKRKIESSSSDNKQKQSSSADAEKPRKKLSKRNACFNCGAADHTLADCVLPRDQVKIDKNLSEMRLRIQASTQRSADKKAFKSKKSGAGLSSSFVQKPSSGIL
ncbi:unnamed protein product [Sphagnum balticum]